MKPAGEITCEEWETLPIEKLVQQTILNMTAKQLELRHLNNTIYYVLNQEHRSDPLLTSNDVARLLGKTPKFIPTPKKLTPESVARDCDLYIDSSRPSNALLQTILFKKPKNLHWQLVLFLGNLKNFHTPQTFMKTLLKNFSMFKNHRDFSGEAIHYSVLGFNCS